ncbi:hypothetical protein LCGC14_0548250 [marine sediment metagenome]|uniref:Uncharacterized protein n=1 Tax=marine sediment metagenome TaxID=412755 RepID=A0A0F9RVI2_9ZZZZ
MKKTIEELRAEKEELLKLESKQAESELAEKKRKELEKEVATLKHKTSKSGKIIEKIKSISTNPKLKKGFSKFQDFADKYG